MAFSHYNNLSAQLPIDPATGLIVAGGVKEQTVQCLRNVKAILESIDVPSDDIVKITIFLRDLSDVDAVDEVYTTFFPDSGIARTVGYLPARTTVAASGLPMDALVQIEAVVSHGDGTPPQARRGHGTDSSSKPNNTDDCAEEFPVHADRGLLALQQPFRPVARRSEDPARWWPAAWASRPRQCLENIKAIVESVDHAMDDVVKVNIFLKDIADIDAVDEVYSTFFPTGVPARRTVGVSALPGDALIQIDAVLSNAEGTPPKA